MVWVERIEKNHLGISAVGLGILPQICSHDIESNINNHINKIVVKSGLRIRPTAPKITNNDYYDSQFLKSCHLCAKPLRLDQDIFMYRGDEGFCSEECRNRKIMVDERREKEKKLTSLDFDCRGCETCSLLEDLRRRRHRRPTNYQPIFSLS